MDDNTTPTPNQPTVPPQQEQPLEPQQVPQTVQAEQPQPRPQAEPQVSVSGQIAQPVTPAAVAAQPGLPEVPAQKGKKSKNKLILPLILIGAFVLAGGAAAYQTVFSKSPEQLFKSALTNTSKGLDTLLAIDQSSKGMKIDGSFDVSSPLAVDGTLSGQWYETNGSMTASVGAAGVRVNSEIRTIDADNSDAPDVYFKLGGLEGVDGLLRTFVGPEADQAAEVVQSLNDQWYAVDHTLIEQALAAGQLETGQIPELSEDELQGISDAVAGVMRERLFGSDADKAVFKINEEIGKEDFEGTDTYKFDVGVDKDNFVAFLESFEAVVKDTKLKDIVEMSYPGQSIDDLLDFGSISESLKDTDFSDARADVWVEGNGRFIRNVRIYPMSDQKDTNYLDFSMPYEGGDVIPLVIRATVDDTGAKGVLSFGIDMNQQNGNSRFWFDVDMTSDATPVKAKGELKFESTDEEITVEIPTDAKSALELVNQITGSLQSVAPGYLDNELYPSGTNPALFDDIEIPTGEL